MRSDRSARPAGQQSVWLPVGAVALTVALFGAVLATVSLRLRTELRSQILGRDAHVLTQVAALQGLAQAAEAPLDPDLGVPMTTGNPDLEALFQTEKLNELASRMRGLLAARLFDAKGQVVLAMPPTLSEDPLPPDDLAALRQSEPVSRFRPRVRRADLFPPDRQGGDLAGATRPILEVAIPLHSPDERTLVGIAQLLFDGESIAAEFAALDHHLGRQAAGVFGVGSTLLVLGLAWAFRRLHRTNRLLHERTLRLLRANEELAMAARTSAVGAVTAHLIHGLKNPLSGLQQFVHDRGEADAANGDDLWAEAVRSTWRVQEIVREVTRVLQEEQATVAYELTTDEFLDLVRGRVAKRAEAAGVGFQVQGGSRRVLTNREANLLLLILENLLSNAIEASPRGGKVRLIATTEAPGARFVVRDEGPGLPPALIASLFKPIRSTKPHGTGIGLAISHQLALHLGARLELAQSTAQGATFTLTLPGPPP